MHTCTYIHGYIHKYNLYYILLLYRLSTIQNADLIVCIDEGNIVETGSHGELMKLEGFYHEMVTAQVN